MFIPAVKFAWNQMVTSEGLDLLVERLIKILIYDATILNTKSPADSSTELVSQNSQQEPKYFPH